ncbi:hypothetical protein Are01nite_33780 [Actinoplanes regularis]|nr:hypothetical protein Are01nite_33780 [Actinoplanes regularis]
MFALVGVGVAAGAMIGMGPAQADPSVGRPASGQASHSRDFVIGYYDTKRSCEEAGSAGQWYSAWEDYDCDPVRVGWRGRLFQLIVDEGDWLGAGGPWPSGWPYRTDYPSGLMSVDDGLEPQVRPTVLSPISRPAGLSPINQAAGLPSVGRPAGLSPVDRPVGSSHARPAGSPTHNRPAGSPTHSKPAGSPMHSEPAVSPPQGKPVGARLPDQPVKGTPPRDNSGGTFWPVP